MKKTLVILSILLASLIPSVAHAAPTDPNGGAGNWTGCRKVGSAWVCTPIWPVVRR